jgi:M-phase inducer tyrosine phosphatase
MDRAVNDFRYPALTYPEVYILEGGYSSFFSIHRERCFPQNYVEMGAKEHANTCERMMGRLQRRTKLSRAKTFAFGQHDDSPTAVGKSSGGDLIMDNDSPFGKSNVWSTSTSDDLFGSFRLPNRRMASY